MLDHQWDVAALLDKLDDPRTGHPRRRALLDELREVLTIWWQTDEVRRVRPHVEDEVRRTLFFFEAVLFDAVPGGRWTRWSARSTSGSSAGALLRQLDGRRHGRPPRGRRRHAGQRAALHRATALRLLRERVDAAGAQLLALRAAHPDVARSWRRRWRTTRASCRRAEVLRRAHHEWEPLRTKLGFVHHRLINMLRPRGREPGYADARQLRADLELARPPRLRHVALGSIRRLLRQVDVFGFHLAGIDLRQSATSSRGGRARCCRATRSADEPRRMALLTEAMASGRRGIEHDPGGEAGELLRALDAVALARRGLRRAGRAGDRDLDDRAAVGRARRALARAARAARRRCAWCRCSRRSALDAAPATMAMLYALEPYREHLRAQGNRQTVMVGYSDSGKDSGYIASQ